jgi:hypothetical protein
MRPKRMPLYRRLTPESRLLDSMNVRVQFTQTDPQHD